MRRREFILALAGTAAWPLAARAQTPMPLIGFLHQGAADTRTGFVTEFHRGLKDFGYEEGRNVAVEYRWANDEPDRLPELAAHLVRRQVAVIIAGSSIQVDRTVKAATSTIPIVLVAGTDLLRTGVVGSLSRPDGNITGVNVLGGELMAKRLDLLRELVPQATTVACLTFDQRIDASQYAVDDILAAARTLGRQVVVAEARSDRDFEPAFATFVDRRAGALVVLAAALFLSNRDKLLALAARHRLPAIYPFREFVPDGGLMSYGPSFTDAWRLGGHYVGRILKGEKPADLPVQQSSRFELVINLQAAKALGLEIPPPLLARADEVIE
jgi:putative ABC transport system substrate-binding protein